MKAWRIYGPDDMRLDEIPIPEIKPGWVLAKIKKVQVSVTEVANFRSLSENPGKSSEGGPPRQMYGHEFCAEVIETGEGVCNVKTGDRIFYYGRPACRNCAMCRAGYEELCCKGPMLGIDIPGGLAEYVLLPGEGMMSIPPVITDSEAAAMQPLVGTLGAISLVGVEMGDTVVVLGQGSMGLNATQICRVSGAGKVIGVDINEDNLAMATRLGADAVVNASREEPVEAVLKATDGVGADLVFDCAGGNPKMGLSGVATVTQAMRIVRDQGKISQIALLGADARVDVSPINSKGVLYRGLGSSTAKLARYAVDLVATKRVQLAPLVTHVFDGLDKMPQAFEITGNKARYKAINPAQVNVI
ncbi:MAG: zinc-binding dehydrogenase [Dehalococcoidales bacterium]|nr:zinc-binding dehydrogenase [Dehalococcoidales bacterium]